MLRSSWAFYLKKCDLLALAKEFGFKSTGTEEDLQTNFYYLLSQQDHKLLQFQRLLELQSKYTAALDDDIQKRYQLPKENFTDFVLDLQNMMRHADYSEKQMLDVIYNNSQSEYHWFIQRKHFKTLTELIMLVENFDNFRKRELNKNVDSQDRSENDEFMPAITKREQISFTSNVEKCSKNQSPNQSKTLHYECNNRMFANIFIEEISVEAIINTGIPKSYVSGTFVNRLGPNCKVLAYDGDTPLIDNSENLLKRVIHAKISFGNCSGIFEFLLSPNTSKDVVLGLDFLAYTGTTVICAGETLMFEKPSVELPVRPQVPSAKEYVPIDNDPLQYADLSMFDEETVAEIRELIKNFVYIPGRRFGFLRIIRGQRIHFKVTPKNKFFPILKPLRISTSPSQNTTSS